jgi:hypothetical protein
MNSIAKTTFAAACLMMNVGFYYKRHLDHVWRDYDEWASHIVDEAISRSNDAELRALKEYLPEMMSSPDAEKRLQSAWDAEDPMVFLFRETPSGAREPAYVKIFQRVLRRIEARRLHDNSRDYDT